MWNHFSKSTLTTVFTIWFGVQTTRLNLVNASVIMRTFSLPDFDGSILVKSRQTNVMLHMLHCVQVLGTY